MTSKEKIKMVEEQVKRMRGLKLTDSLIANADPIIQPKLYERQLWEEFKQLNTLLIYQYCMKIKELEVKKKQEPSWLDQPALNLFELPEGSVPERLFMGGLLVIIQLALCMLIIMLTVGLAKHTPFFVLITSFLLYNLMCAKHSVSKVIDLGKLKALLKSLYLKQP